MKIDQATDVLESAALSEILNKLSEAQLAELEDELNFAHFTGIFGPNLSKVARDSICGKQRSMRQKLSRAA